MGQSVLVVDTTDRQLGHITQTLRDQGYSPDVVQTEAELLEALEATDAQLVFFNLQVQGVLEICDSMRSSMAGAIVPAIFMGCGDDADSAIRSPADALSAGGDYYFAAPFDIPRVIAKVRTYVGLSQQDDAAVVDLGDLDRPGRHRLPEQAPPDPLVGASDAVLAAICDREAELASRRDESHDVYGGGQSHVEDGHGGSGDDAHLRGESHDGDGHAGRKSHGDGKGRDDYGRETKGGSGQRQDVLLPAAGPLEPSATAPAPAPVYRNPPPAAPAGGVAAAAATPAATTTYRPLSPASGHLSPSYDMARLLYDAFVQRVTGRIGLENGHAQTMVFFIDGAPTRVQSLQSAHRLEEYLLSTKKISLTHYQQVRLRGLRRSQQVKAFLLEKNVLGADVLEEALHTQLREQLMELFAYTTASFSYSPQLCDVSSRLHLRLDVRNLIMQAIRRHYVLPQLVDRVGNAGTFVNVRPEQQIQLDALTLTGAELALLSLLDGRRSLQEVATLSGLKMERVYQAVYGMLCVEAARIARPTPSAEDEAAQAAAQAATGRIHEKLQQVRMQDYLQILDLRPEASMQDVEAAYLRTSQNFAPAAFAPGVQNEQRQNLQEIKMVLLEAYDVLRDPQLRPLYCRHVA